VAGAFLYALRGGASGDFRQYFFPTPIRGGGFYNSPWVSKSSFGHDVGHSALTWNSDSSSHGSVVYGIGKNSDTKFQGYNESNNSWAELARPRTSHGAGVSLAAQTIGGANDTIYWLRGGGSSNFRRYRISANSWNAAASTPWSIGAGAGLAFCPNDRKFYATRGGETPHFAQYQPYAQDDDDSDGFGGGQSGAETPVDGAAVTCRMSGRGTYLLSYPAAAGRDATFAVHDATGRLLSGISTREGQVEWRPPSSGVHLVVVTGPGLHATGRLTAVR